MAGGRLAVGRTGNDFFDVDIDLRTVMASMWRRQP
jgi:hypothetical protein